MKTLEQLAEFINMNDEWKIEVIRIIAANGWNDDTGEDFGICTDRDGRRLVFNDNMVAVII